MRLSDQYETINRFTKSAPVDLIAMASALGLKVKQAFLENSISGMLERLPGNIFLITINANHSKTRQRFTLAHELGHYMLHRHLVGDGVDDNLAYRSTELGKYHNTLIGPEEETEANKFAANVLMPRNLIEQSLFDDDISIRGLAAKFEVSEHAMSIRRGVSYPA